MLLKHFLFSFCCQYSHLWETFQSVSFQTTFQRVSHSFHQNQLAPRLVTWLRMRSKADYDWCKNKNMPDNCWYPELRLKKNIVDENSRSSSILQSLLCLESFIWDISSLIYTEQTLIWVSSCLRSYYSVWDHIQNNSNNYNNHWRRDPYLYFTLFHWNALSYIFDPKIYDDYVPMGQDLKVYRAIDLWLWCPSDLLWTLTFFAQF